MAWASQSGNPTTVSVELSPHLNAEGYKKAGWLFNELEGRYGKKLLHYKHSDWFSTQCPGTISISRIKAEAKKWKNGDYDKKPAPKPKPEPPRNLTYHLWKEGETEYVVNKSTYLYDVGTKTWSGVKNVKRYSKGEKITIVGHVHNKALNRDYYITRHSFDNKKPTGFHPADLDVYVPPRPKPEPPKEPVEPTDPVEPPENEYPGWFTKLVADFITWIRGKLGL